MPISYKASKANLRAVFLLFLLTTSFLLLMVNYSNFGFDASAQVANSSVVEAVNSSLLQYEWPTPEHDAQGTRFSPGPAPNSPDILWSVKLSEPLYYGQQQIMMTAFDQKVFAFSKNNSLYAFDALTGQQIWKVTMPFPEISSSIGAYKIDDERFIVPYGNGLMCFITATGQLLWNTTNMFLRQGPRGGAGSPWMPFVVDPTTKMIYAVVNNASQSDLAFEAFDLSNPLQPPRSIWKYSLTENSEMLAYGDGKLFGGTYGNTVFALNATTGKLLWETFDKGERLYSGVYYQGNLYAGQASNLLSCYEGNTGKILWSYSAGSLGFFAWGGAIAYGRYFQHNIRAGESFISSWDANTGNVLWDSNNASLYLGHLQPVVADGKVYVSTIDSVGSTISNASRFTCFDAYTGAILWQVPGFYAFPAIAYGNLYVASAADNSIICFGQPKPWAMWRGNIDQPGVAVGQSAPSVLMVKWAYSTNGPVTSSPTIVDGKVYIGSHDRNLYCLDARNGTRLWNFTIGSQFLSTVAVVNGRLYTGADDGNIYCINANNGSQIWKTTAGGFINVVFQTLWQPKSSPIVVSDKLFVGALDGKVYCLNISNGAVLWTFQTGAPIGGSAAYSNGTIYITSCDSYIYALNAVNGQFVWKTQLPVKVVDGVIGTRHLVCTPLVVNGTLYVGSGVDGGALLNLTSFFALNTQNGSLLWALKLNSNSFPIFTPTYVNGALYFPEGVQISAYNVTDQKRLWFMFMGIDALSSVAYADGKTFVGSDTYSIYEINATSGSKMSSFETGDQVISSPAIWENKIYVGSNDWNVYCFSDGPTTQTALNVSPNKSQLNVNEALTLNGQLSPGIPNAIITITFIKPDNSKTDLTTRTDLKGQFSITFKPDLPGNWSWTVKYDGSELPVETYASSTTPSSQFQTTQTSSPVPSSPPATPVQSTAPPSESPSASPSSTVAPSSSVPITYTQAAIVAAIFVLIIVLVVILFVRRTKPELQNRT